MSVDRGKTRVKASIVHVKRRSNTASGNPRYTLVTPYGKFDTEPDAQVNYIVSDGLAARPRLPREVELTLNGSGRVIGCEFIERGEA